MSDKPPDDFARRAKDVFTKHNSTPLFRLTLLARTNKRNEPPVAMFTYDNLKDFLATLAPEQLRQQVQLLKEHGDLNKPVRLDLVIAAGTVAQLCSTPDGECVVQTRSAVDFAHHPEQVVLATDGCPFTDEGDSWYDMDTDEDGETVLVGNKSGKRKPILERKRCEPSLKARRTPVFQHLSQWNDVNMASDAELEAMQEVLCATSGRESLSGAEYEMLDHVQAELYRRIYRLPPREEKP